MPQPLVQAMERISVVGPGHVDAQGAPLAETAKGRLSELPWISAHGQFVVFSTAANTLDQQEDDNSGILPPSDPNNPGFRGDDTGGMDVYLVDRSLPESHEARVRRISRRQNDNGTPNRGSSFGVIDDHANITVFQSRATDLDPNSTNEGPGTRKTFMVDLTTGLTTQVSRNADSVGQFGRFPAVSGNGHFIFFSSTSTAIPRPGGGAFDDLDADPDVFRFNTDTEEFGIVTPASTEGDGFPAASLDGQWAAIESAMPASDLTGLALEDKFGTNYDIFLVDGASAGGVSQPPTFPVSLSINLDNETGNPQMGIGHSRYPAISHDGRFVAFVSWTGDQVPGDGLGNPDTFVRDMGAALAPDADPSTTVTGPTARVSVGGSTTSGPIVDNAIESGCAWGCRPSVVHIPSDGVNPGLVIVAFVTLGGFDQFDENDAWDVYVRVMRADDLSVGDTYLVSAPAHDANGYRPAADFGSFNPHLRAEMIPEDPGDPELTNQLHLRVAFESYATNLDPSITDGNDTRDIYYAELVVPVSGFE